MKQYKGIGAALFVLLLVAAVVGSTVAGPGWPNQGLAGKPAPSGEVAIGAAGHSVARIWNEVLLDTIRIDRPKPPVHARNLFHLSVAMWDAWATYDTDAIGYVVTEKNSAVDVEAARAEAISYAALRLLQYRFPGGGFDLDGQLCQPGAATSQASFIQTMLDLGYDPDVTTTVGVTPAAVGNRIGAAVIAHGQGDGAYEGFDLCYPDDSGYFPINPELIFDLAGTTVFDPNRWQPLAFDFLILQNGIIIGQALQAFVGIAWGDVEPFALAGIPAGGDPPACGTVFGAPPPLFDPGCPPQLGGAGDAELKAAIVEVIQLSGTLDPTQGEMIDISPSAYLNNTLGTDDGIGRPTNPYTGQPYPPNVVNRGDHGRVLAEFWADGPHSETPPGHWNTLANYVTDHPLLGQKRIAGTSAVVNDLEWDVKLYFALNGAVHDAAVAAWGTKHRYDSSRPITLVRHMTGLGQSTDMGATNYHPDGIPLVPGLIETITSASIAPGERHEHLSAFCFGGGFNEGEPCTTDADCPDDGPFDGYCDSSVDKIAIRAWQGGPEDPETQIGGVGWILGINWMPFQADFFVTPPFPGYTSGHSTFSRAGARVLANFTGNEFFPGGYGSYVAVKNEDLDFELGPTETVELQWATYNDAADEAGISRRFGGIHPWYDDYPGRVQGYDVGESAFARALQFYNMELVDPDDDEGDDESDDEGDDEGDDGPLNRSHQVTGTVSGEIHRAFAAGNPADSSDAGGQAQQGQAGEQIERSDSDRRLQKRRSR